MRTFEKKASPPSPRIHRVLSPEGKHTAITSGQSQSVQTEPYLSVVPEFDFGRLSIDQREQTHPLPATIRRRAEQATGADLSDVQLHTGGASAASAIAFGARAYTVGQNIHFAPGEYAPGTEDGNRLLAHELIHVLQQADTRPSPHQRFQVSSPVDPAEQEATALTDHVMSGTAIGAISQTGSPRVSRWIIDDIKQWWKEWVRANRPEWGSEYKRRRVQVGDLPYNDYKNYIGTNAVPDIPDLKAAHDWGGRELVDPNITRDELIDIFPLLATDSEVDAKVTELNRAFSIMMIDTVEAQALYLAHAYVESQQFTQMKEVGGEKKFYAPFYGRGPLQVTNEQGYVQSLAYLEKRAEQLEQEGKIADAARAREAVAEIKYDPDAALKPEYTYLLSAAFMHQGGGVRGAHTVAPGANFHGGAEATWMIGGNLDAKLANAIAKQDKSQPADIRAIGARDEREIRNAMAKAAEKSAAYTEALRVLGNKPIKQRPKNTPARAAGQ